MPRNAVAFEAKTKEDERKPGAYKFLHAAGIDNWPEGQPLGIQHGCPCGCGGLTALWFAGAPVQGDKWSVAGEWPKVTLAPSIGVKYDGQGNGPTHYHWHGYLRNGVFEEC